MLALDRQERGQGKLSAVQEVEAAYAVRCVSIITLSDLIESLPARRDVPQRSKRCVVTDPSTVFSDSNCGVAHYDDCETAGT